MAAEKTVKLSADLGAKVEQKPREVINAVKIWQAVSIAGATYSSFYNLYVDSTSAAGLGIQRPGEFEKVEMHENGVMFTKAAVRGGKTVKTKVLVPWANIGTVEFIEI